MSEAGAGGLQVQGQPELHKETYPSTQKESNKDLVFK